MKLKDWVNRLIWATILVTVVRYSAAFMASDMGQITGVASEVVTFFLTLTGLGMGVLDTLGGGLLFNGWSRVFPKTGNPWSLKFKVLTFCVFSLVISGMIILVPFTVSRLAHESVLDTLGGKGTFWTWLWSGMVNVIPYILIAGVFAGNRIIADLELQQGTSETTSGTNGNFQKTSETTSGSSNMGRPSIHQARVFSYLDDFYSKTGLVPNFKKVMDDLQLPQSTASRLRNDWIDLRKQGN